ncbi:nucleotide-binding domain-containing protein, partial [Caulochytrium protostelioides]
LMEQMRAQSERFGTTIVSETIARVDLRQRPFRLWREGQEHDDGAYEEADALIVATGATAKRLHLPGEERLWQKGISACAVCDGALPLFRNQPLIVVGGGDSAAEEALFLTKYASRVYVAVRRDVLRASKIMAQRLQRHPKVEILGQTQPVEAVGD